MEKFYLVSADAILVTHFAFVSFVVVSVILIWLGYFFRWHFVRNFYFRAAHLLCIGFVIIQTLLGKVCPLTILENQLRIKAGVTPLYHTGCITYWLDRLLFYEADQRVLSAAYYTFFGLVVLSLILVRPRRPPKRNSHRGTENTE